MYFKVASIAFLGVFLSGCSATAKPEPKKQNIKVVEEIDNSPTTISPVQTDVVKKKVKAAPSKKEQKYKLKPEPFSLESNEDDPELLGPQTTIDRGLSNKEDSTEDTNSKSKEKKLPSTDNKKETL